MRIVTRRIERVQEYTEQPIYLFQSYNKLNSPPKSTTSLLLAHLWIDGRKVLGE